MNRTTVVIMGAAGRDFHNFNVYFRDDDRYQVIAFTATQIPNIHGRKYPAQLAGKLYPEGIPIHPEAVLPELIRRHGVHQVVFAYSDVSHEHVMHKASLALSSGADFKLLGARSTMLESRRPVVSICAVRTGSGKSQTTRKVCDILRERGKKLAVIRHPMPYGDLLKQRVQRFAEYADLDRHDCTIEEREEYEPHLARGNVVYAGVDYEAILREAEQDADVIVWDGGNNDFPFYLSDLAIVLCDPHRPGHELTYHPGESTLRMADVVIINKQTTARFEDIEKVRENVRSVNPKAIIIDAASPLFVDRPDVIKNKSVLVVEDGPTLTHGGMEYGAGTVAARKYGAREIVDPRPYAVGSMAETLSKYPNIKPLLPAMGYGEEQMKDLEATIEAADCEAVIIGTPTDLRKVIDLKKPSVMVTYELQEIGQPNLTQVLDEFLKRVGGKEQR